MDKRKFIPVVKITGKTHIECYLASIRTAGDAFNNDVKIGGSALRLESAGTCDSKQC